MNKKYKRIDEPTTKPIKSKKEVIYKPLSRKNTNSSQKPKDLSFNISFQRKTSINSDQNSFSQKNYNLRIGGDKTFRETVITNWKQQKRRSSELLDQISVSSENPNMSQQAYSQNQSTNLGSHKSQFNSPVPPIVNQNQGNKNLHTKNSIDQFYSHYYLIYHMNPIIIQHSPTIHTNFPYNPFFYQKQNQHTLQNYKANCK